MCASELSLALAYRSSRAHGFAPSVVHFPVKSAYLCRKLSDRMSEGGAAELVRAKLCSCGAVGRVS